MPVICNLSAILYIALLNLYYCVNDFSKEVPTTISFILSRHDIPHEIRYHWKSDQPVWDEQGHYRGTNALLSVAFTTYTMAYSSETVERKDIGYPTNGVVDLSNIRVFESVRYVWEEWCYDVSNQLDVKDYGFLEDETFYVDLVAPVNYLSSSREKIKPLRILIPKPDDTTEPQVTTAVTETETTITTFSAETTSTTAKETTTTSQTTLKHSFFISDNVIKLKNSHGNDNCSCGCFLRW